MVKMSCVGKCEPMCKFTWHRHDDGVEIFENITTLNEGSYLEVYRIEIDISVAENNYFASSSYLGS